LVVLILGSCQTATTNIQSSESSKDQYSIKVYSKIKGIQNFEIKRVEKEAQVAVNNVIPILGYSNTKRFKIKIVDYGICRVSNGTILLPIWHVRDKTAAIVHEMTHVIAKHSENRFFSEGIAVYFQERFGEDKGFPNFRGDPIDDLVRENSEDLFKITNLAKNNDIFRKVGTFERQIAYIQAGSFIDYLVKTYGEEKFRNLHNSWTLNYKKVYGKSLVQLENEWKKGVLGE